MAFHRFQQFCDTPSRDCSIKQPKSKSRGGVFCGPLYYVVGVLEFNFLSPKSTHPEGPSQLHSLRNVCRQNYYDDHHVGRWSAGGACKQQKANEMERQWKHYSNVLQDILRQEKLGPNIYSTGSKHKFLHPNHKFALLGCAPPPLGCEFTFPFASMRICKGHCGCVVSFLLTPFGVLPHIRMGAYTKPCRFFQLIFVFMSVSNMSINWSALWFPQCPRFPAKLDLMSFASCVCSCFWDCRIIWGCALMNSQITTCS